MARGVANDPAKDRRRKHLFTPDEDALIIRAYRQGVKQRSIARQLNRHKNSIYYRVNVLVENGKLSKHPKFRRRKTIHVRVPQDLHDKINAQAVLKGVPVTLYVEQLLRKLLD